MSLRFSHRRWLAAGCFGLPLLAGCAQMQNISGESALRCGQATVGGALAGMAIGGLTGSDDAGRDAAIGAVAGALACIAYEYQTQRIKSAQEAEADYQKAVAATTLPERTVVTAYQARLDPGSAIQAGSQATLVSDFTLIAGRSSPTPVVEESLDLFSPTGKKVSSAKKTVTAATSSGAYRNQFRFKMPEGVPEGVYPVKLTLLADGSAVRTTEAQLQIARAENGVLLARVISAVKTETATHQGQLPPV